MVRMAVPLAPNILERDLPPAYLITYVSHIVSSRSLQHIVL